MGMVVERKVCDMPRLWGLNVTSMARKQTADGERKTCLQCLETSPHWMVSNGDHPYVHCTYGNFPYVQCLEKIVFLCGNLSFCNQVIMEVMPGTDRCL